MTGRLSYGWEGPAPGSPSQLAVISVTNPGDWSRRPWKVLARSWLPRTDDLCALPDWTACPDAGPAFMVDGRAMAILATSRD